MRSANGFGRIDLLAVFACVALITVIAIALLEEESDRSTTIRCVNNLKQSALALKIFSSDCGDRYPYQTIPSITVSGPHATIALTNQSIADITQQAAWAQWAVLSNELGSPKVISCPGHRAKRKSVASEWSSGRPGFYNPNGFAQMHRVNHTQDEIDYNGNVGYDLSIGYFICLNAEETAPGGIMAGDGNLAWTSDSARGMENEVNPEMAGLQVINDAIDTFHLRFSHGRHHSKPYRQHDYMMGNIALTDGSVVHVNSAQLRQAFQASMELHAVTNHWVVIPQ